MMISDEVYLHIQRQKRRNKAVGKIIAQLIIEGRIDPLKWADKLPTET